MLGNATLTIVPSRQAMNMAADVTSRTCQRRSSCFMQPTVHERVASRYAQAVLPRTYDGQNCSIARTLELVGDRWTMLVVREAFLGRRRFDELADRLGIARNVLAARLARLVEEGVLERVRYQERPERFEYHLTAKGRDLWPVLMSLLQYGDRHYAPAAPPPEGTHRGCGGRG